MIEFISIKDVGINETLDFPLSYLNIITGKSCSGYSILMKILLRLSCYYKIHSLDQECKDEHINFIIKLNNEEPVQLTLYDNDIRSYGLKNRDNSIDKIYRDKKNIFSKSSCYVRNYDTLNYGICCTGHKYNLKYNENIRTFYEKVIDNIPYYNNPKSNLNIEALAHPSATSLNYVENLKKWIFEALTDQKPECNSIIFNYIKHELAITIDSLVRIISAIISAKNDDFIIIEDPENGLHEEAQIVLAKLFSIASSSGVQILLKTNSEVLFNAIRLEVKKQSISEKNVKILHCEVDKVLNKFYVTTPKINENGQLDIWPTGFFDVNSKLLEKLLT